MILHVFYKILTHNSFTIRIKANGEYDKDIETWYGDFRRKDRFTVRETTYFEVGQKITFYRLGENEQKNPI